MYGQELNTAPPPSSQYRAESGSNWCHGHNMAELLSSIFSLHLYNGGVKKVETRCPSLFIPMTETDSAADIA